MFLMLLLAMAMQSHHVFAQSVTITLMPGWNWISVPLMDTLDFETALGSFTPVTGDMIKSQWGNASFRADGYWRGQISQFYPGYGYKYYSNRTMPVTVTFNAQQPAPNNTPTGAINGKFTINENGGQVYFSQGNLQYQASTDTWKFAENQWDYVGTQTPDYNGNFGGTVSGSDNRNISSTYSGWIDLFGWGTSGYNHGANCYQPWSTSTENSDYYAYGNYQYNLYDQTGQADWGYNPISNGGNQTNQWRTLTRPEWDYVFNTRPTTSGIRYAKANVNNVNGVILLPDDWSTSTYSLSSTNTYNASFSSNTLTASQWNTLEQAGAVFLPAAGGRDWTSVDYAGSSGRYWSASYFNNNAFFVLFYDSYLGTSIGNHRFEGVSVRLVAPYVESSSLSVTTTEVTDISQTAAVCGGVVTDDGGTTVTERGICWSTSPNPTINDNHVSSGTGTGSYTVNMTGLIANTTYYVRAYATNGAGTAYGNEVSFITLQDETSLPVVTTSSVYNITRNSAIGGGTVVSDGGCAVTERGICWSTSSNPTINNYHTNSGTGLGNYTVNMSSLSANTTYYVKAYAINSAGVAYGDAVQFKTPPSATVNGCFSVNGNGGKICFSKGNLQCRPSSETWKFADHQYDCIGTGNIYIQQSYTGYIDLFGWGTSGYPHGATCYEPWSTSMNDENYYAYGNSTYNLYDRSGYADWGNSSHSINGSNRWRTLKTEEWIYIINQRYTQSGLRYAKAQVNGVNGLILLPDDWSTSYYSLNYPDQYSVGYNTNVITSSQWNTLENHGAVFLPAAGFRGSSSVFQLNSTGAYWSSSCVGVMGFDGNSVGCNNNDRHTGRSVRLVCDTQ